MAYHRSNAYTLLFRLQHDYLWRPHLLKLYDQATVNLVINDSWQITFQRFRADITLI